MTTFTPKTRSLHRFLVLGFAWGSLVVAVWSPQHLSAQATGIEPPPFVEEQSGTGFKELNRLQKSNRATILDEPTVSAQTPEPNSDVQAPFNRVPTPQSNFNNDRVNSIHDRIKLIKRLMEEEKAAAAPVKPTLMTPSSTNPPPGIDTTNPPPSPTNPIQTAIETGNSEANSATDPATELTSIPRPEASGTPITAKPINSFELGNSLFLTGNLVASRKSYQARLKDAQTPEEDAWLRCLIGCCYRLEGDLANAELMYREVTQHKLQSYPVEYAQWGLQYVEQKRKTREQYQIIESELESMLKESKQK